MILGAGRFGTHLASRLSEMGCDVLIADHSPAIVKDLADDGYRAIEMDAEDEDALREAGVLGMDAVVVAIGADMQSNILTTLTLKQLGTRKVVARAEDTKHARVLEKIGADMVIVPSLDMANVLAERLRSDARHERFPLAGDYLLGEIAVGGALDGVALKDSQLRRDRRLNVVLLLRPQPEAAGGSEEILEPEPDLVLKNGDFLMVVGRRSALDRFEREQSKP